jgi:glycosyltransferase involved in cell wall biosynthesis
VGGVSTYVYALRRELAQRGHEVDILAHYPDMKRYYMPNNGRRLEKAKVKDYINEKLSGYYAEQFPKLENWIRWREVERYCYEAAAAVFCLTKYDLIHTQDIISTRALWRVKPKHVPLIATIHGCLATEYRLSGEIRDRHTMRWRYAAASEYYGATSSDMTIVPTTWLKELLANDFRVPREHLQLIRYGMDVDAFVRRMEKPSKIVKPPGKKVMICPARLVPVKGHEHLLRALAKLKEDRVDWVCWLVGDGPLRQRLEHQARRRELTDHVRFLGNRDDVPALLRQADVFVLPSVQDNLPYAVIEAQIAGVPVVVSDAGGIPEMVVHGQTGLVSPAGDSSALYSSLKRVLADGAYRAALAAAARQHASERWSLRNMVDDTLEMYRKYV